MNSQNVFFHIIFYLYMHITIKKIVLKIILLKKLNRILIKKINNINN